MITSESNKSNSDHLISPPPPGVGYERETEPRDCYLGSNKMRSINIETLDFGYNVRVGCQTIAIETKEKLAKLVSEYIIDPDATEQRYHSKNLI